MKFLADECCDVGLIESLRADGHDVVFAMEKLKGEEDDIVLNNAFKEDRILITEDKDFGELVYRLNKPAKGVILIRIPIAKRHHKWERLKILTEKYAHRLSDHFVIVEEQKFRFRPLKH